MPKATSSPERIRAEAWLLGKLAIEVQHSSKISNPHCIWTSFPCCWNNTHQAEGPTENCTAPTTKACWEMLHHGWTEFRLTQLRGISRSRSYVITHLQLLSWHGIPRKAGTFFVFLFFIPHISHAVTYITKFLEISRSICLPHLPITYPKSDHRIFLLFGWMLFTKQSVDLGIRKR